VDHARAVGCRGRFADAQTHRGASSFDRRTAPAVTGPAGARHRGVRLPRRGVTCARVAEVIERTWGVRYHRAHVSRLLHACGWTAQRPVVKATQRDEQAIAAWTAERLPAIKKNR